MKPNEPMSALISRSSFGDPVVVKLRARTPIELARAVVIRAESCESGDQPPLKSSPKIKRWSPPQQVTEQSEEMFMSKKLTPGTPAPRSGQYREIGPRGGQGREVTVPRDRPLPPTTQPGSGYRLVDPTDNKSGKK